MVEKLYSLMGGEVYVYFESEKSIEIEILKFTHKTLIELISIFNLYDDNSHLTKLNTKGEVEYDSNLAYLLTTSIKLYDLTNGNFNIFLGNEILERKTNKEVNKKLKQKFDINKIITITNEKITLNNKEVKIDLGGIAKGYIVDKTIEIVKAKYQSRLKTILIDARGDIKISGKGEFKIEIENPFNSELSFEFITLKNASIVTSGHNKQNFANGSHIIGNPTDIYTITLISKTQQCHILDALATYFILLTSENSLKLVEFNENFKDIESLIILNNGKVLKTSFWNEYL